jgi:Bacteriophage HK97-gp10, putative tail-component
MADAIKVAGLNEFVRNLKTLDTEVPKALRVALNDCAEIVLGYARPRVPRRSGRARASLKARSTQRAVRVAAGGSKAPYYPWLDFGGRVGRRKSVRRAFIRDGRYIYPALRAKHEEFDAALTKALLGAVRSAGIEVS